MWFKRIIYGLLGVRNREDLKDDLSTVTLPKLIFLFLVLNIAFIGSIVMIIRYFL
jgi:hypothetical protein